MKSLGHHFLIELYDCDEIILEDQDLIKKIMHEAIKICGATEVGDIFYEFSPHGISGVILISESHFSIHSWPENRYAAIDLFTCQVDLEIQKTYQYFCSAFDSKSSSITEIKRGLGFQTEN
jgi:S-adenosylmethionine decarboxylase